MGILLVDFVKAFDSVEHENIYTEMYGTLQYWTCISKNGHDASE